MSLAQQTVIYLIGRILYNLYLHPLSRYPGPLLHRATRVAMVYQVLRGTSHIHVLNLHDEYGPVMRVAYDELSFLDPQAWKDIYNHGLGSSEKAEMPKYHKFYRDPGALPSLLSETKENYSLLRRQLAPGFSERTMQKQEPIINGYVNLLISRLRERCGPGGKSKVDIKDWYNWTTFDIIGDLAFGESFGCLESVGYHAWVRFLFATVRTRAIMQAIQYMGLGSIALPVVKLMKLKARKEHAQRVLDKLKRRIDSGPRCDLIEGLLEREDWELTGHQDLDMGRLRANSSLLIVAGSETTATLFSGVTYLLLKNPDTLKRLVVEIRATFKSDADTNMVSVQQLPYLRACLDEGLRLYPPVPIGMPRVVPEGGAWIAETQVPQDVVVACWHYAMTHSESHWSHPHSFDPCRFLGDGNPDDHLEAFQPFSVGPRNCIGRNLAYAEMRLILARILFNFDLRLADPDVEWLRQKAYIVWEKPGLEVFLEPAQ